MTQTHRTKHETDWLLIIILLAGAYLRWAQIEVLAGMLNTDEAANALDALSLIESPRLTPFFPNYTGRESGWHYWLALFLLAVGTRPLAVRLAATTIGMLTLVAVYDLGRELLPRRAALWSAAALAVLYWHVHLSQIGFRAILFPFIGTLALSRLLHAHRTNRLRGWLSAGALLGLLTYTYFSARMWLGYAGLLLGYWGIREPTKRRGVLLAGTMTIILALPLFLYTMFNPVQSLSRIDEVRVLNVSGILHNAGAWMNAWFHLGDQNVMLNLPGRPILDYFLGFPFLAGLMGLWWVAKKRWYSVWLAGLAGLSIAPSLFSDHAPHFLRAIGLVVPVAILIGTGMYCLERLSQRYIGRLAMLLPLIVVSMAGINTYQAFSRKWLNHPALPEQMELPINEAASFVETTSSPKTPLYFAPILRTNPTVLFWAKALKPRHVATFDSGECWVKTDIPALYVLLDDHQIPPIETLMPKSIHQYLQQDRTLAKIGVNESLILEVRPTNHTGTSGCAATFDERLHLGLAHPLPERALPGETLDINLNFKAQQPMAKIYTVFIHLYGIPSPYEGGPIWAQIDQAPCRSYPMTRWRAFETVNQTFALQVPVDLPAGTYTLVIGLYDPDAGLRLPLTAPAPDDKNYFELGHILID